jgi:3-deoxy-7-phosphoheptulonate synthase
MIIVLKPHADAEAVARVAQHVTDLGYTPRVIQGVEHTVIAAVGDELSHRSLETLQGLDAVANVIPIQKRYKVASREYHPSDSRVMVGPYPLGAGNFQVMAGPCAIENRTQFMTAVKHLTACGVRIIRGGAYKPRTSPYDFQGLAEGGLELLAEAKAQYGVAVVTEVVGVTHVAKVAAVADMLQIGARNCQNYHLLECVAQAGKPVMLKRGMATTVEEWISAGEYLLVNGCPHVVLCERGIRTFETATRGTLDVGAIAVAKQETHLPVVVDPSHAAGKRSLVLPLALAGVAAGADGIIVEAHPDPVNALSDAAQQWPSDQFSVFMDAVRPLVALMGKKLG